MSDQIDWRTIQSQWAFAHGEPCVTGRIKSDPEDFRVYEKMDVEPEGSGEHVWLHITKRKQNTEQLAKTLARHAHVAYRDVGYSGMKDFFAVTEQWFSVWLPSGGNGNSSDEPDWDAFNMDGVVINKVIRHSRKIKRGTHRSNQFVVVVKDLSGDIADIERRMERIKKNGVPNYFGAQRFGQQCNNMNQAVGLLVEKKRIKNRNLRSIILSSARSWLFNCIVSARIESGNFHQLFLGEPANLDGTGSVFNADGGDAESTRLEQLDIHPTAPMWGKIKEAVVSRYDELHQWESSIISDYEPLSKGLEMAGLGYQRRAIRMNVAKLECVMVGESLELSFELTKGQFATSVLREIVLVL